MKVKFVRNYSVKWGGETSHYNKGDIKKVDKKLGAFFISAGIAVEEKTISKKQAVKEAPENKMLDLEETQIYEVKDNE